jgi:arylmalonate decarboxylase
MSTSRREFIQTTAVATTLTAFGVRADLLAADPSVGLIFPPLNYPIPEDAKRLYPKGVTFLSGGVGLPGGMTVEGYDEAVPRIIPAAEALAKQGAKAISVFGSSLTFYKGAKFNQDLVDKVTKATGLPATTQSNGLVDGLRTVNAKRVALATAYTDVVTERLKVFLQEHGFVVTAMKGLGYDRIPESATIGQEVLFKLGVDAYGMSQKADALVVSCGALKTLDLIVPLEKQISVPVVSSTPHGLMNAVRLVGVSPRVKGFGKAFERA